MPNILYWLKFLYKYFSNPNTICQTKKTTKTQYFNKILHFNKLYITTIKKFTKLAIKMPVRYDKNNNVMKSCENFNKYLKINKKSTN